MHSWRYYRGHDGAPCVQPGLDSGYSVSFSLLASQWAGMDDAGNGQFKWPCFSLLNEFVYMSITSNFLRISGVVVFLAVLLFPPADYVSSNIYYPGLNYENEGFVFLGNVGGDLKIRYAQWIIQLLVSGFAAFLTFKLRDDWVLNLGSDLVAKSPASSANKPSGGPTTTKGSGFRSLFFACGVFLLVVAAIVLNELGKTPSEKVIVSQEPTREEVVATPQPPPTTTPPTPTPVPTADVSAAPGPGVLVQRSFTPHPTATPSTPEPTPSAPLRYVLKGTKKSIYIPSGSRLILYSAPTEPHRASKVFESGTYTILISDVNYFAYGNFEWNLVEINGVQGWVPHDSVR